jgi:formate dehydrogenase assembly factor FdhD
MPRANLEELDQQQQHMTLQTGQRKTFGSHMAAFLSSTDDYVVTVPAKYSESIEFACRLQMTLYGAGRRNRRYTTPFNAV